MKKYGRVRSRVIRGGRNRKRAGRALLIVLFFCVSVWIQISSIPGEEEAVPAMQSRIPLEESRDTVLSLLMRLEFPVAKAAAMNSGDRAVQGSWIASLFSRAFSLNQYASHNGAEAALLENREALEVMEKNAAVESTESGEETVWGGFDLIAGEFYYEDAGGPHKIGDTDLLRQNRQMISKLKSAGTTEYLLQNFYSVNPTTKADSSVFNVEKLLGKDCTMKKNPDEPQILIYHTHGASEAFSDSKSGNPDDSIIGVGERLAVILKNQYGYNVIHDKTPYDRINGAIDRNKAYNEALVSLENTLKEHPAIEVLIDLHRDASGSGGKRLCYINGKPTAQVMLFNGLSRSLNGPISYLKNTNLQGNLAFSLRMKLDAMAHFPDFTTRIFLKGYRYNLHLREKSLLIELGNDKNTVREAKNAMEPLAEVLNRVLSGESQ